MNRSKTMTLAAQAMLTSVITNFNLHRTDFDDAPTRLGLVSIDDDSSGATGGEVIKSDDGTVVAKGTLVGEGAEQTQQQAAAASAVAPGTETLSAKKDGDGGELGGQAKTVIGDPAAGQVQQD